MKKELFADYFRYAPAGIDLSAIRRQWLSLSPPYDVNHWILPLPVWGHRNYDHSGDEAWEVICRDLDQSRNNNPFSIYIHVPFCSSKCHFCDCYSFKLGSHCESHIQRYVDRLCYEMDLWSRQGNLSQRPVSTVHLGGGTPTFLGAAAFRQLIECCKSSFSVSDETEWALESTVESLTPEMIATMDELGFRRLHLGVQSLQEPVRKIIKRRRPVEEVLAKIDETLSLGWIVSVDLVCGLPLQSVDGFVSDIQRLIEAGVHGFSFYELLIYPQNRKWAESHNLTRRSHLPNYFMFQVGATLLEGHGFQKNLFNHWANELDENIYFSFPLRGEDCLALGTIADGVFEDYHYRHPCYAAYLREAQSNQPGLQGGLRRLPQETELLPLTTAVLSGSISPDLGSVFQGMKLNGSSLLAYWLEMTLIEETGPGGYKLTANGSWFAGNMIKDLMQISHTVWGTV